MSTLKRKVRVTITKEIEVEFPPEFFNRMGTSGQAEYLAEFNRSIWKIDGIDDVFKYAARAAAVCGSGFEHDALGLVSYEYSTYPRVPDVKFKELMEEIEEEIISEDGEPPSPSDPSQPA